MTRPLEVSGFLGLAVTMLVGLYQGYLFTVESVPPFWIVDGHVHLGVLSILAIVVGFTLETVDGDERLRRAVTGCYLAGQWLLPATWWLAFGTDNEPVMMTLFLWGALLLIAMVLSAWLIATEP